MQGPGLAIHQPDSVLNSMNAWCTETHNKSGLTNRCRESNVSLEEAETKASTLKTQLPLQDSSPRLIIQMSSCVLRSCSFCIQPSSKMHASIKSAKYTFEVPLLGSCTVNAWTDSVYCSRGPWRIKTIALSESSISPGSAVLWAHVSQQYPTLAGWGFVCGCLGGGGGSQWRRHYPRLEVPRLQMSEGRPRPGHDSLQITMF